MHILWLNIFECIRVQRHYRHVFTKEKNQVEFNDFSGAFAVPPQVPSPIPLANIGCPLYLIIDPILDG